VSGRISVEDHQAAIRSLLPSAVPGPFETLPLREALGRVNATAVSSPVDLPLFRNSQMDGFAVVAADLATLPATLRVVGEVAARRGTPPNLERGTAVRIMTGAVVPEGADAVVPVEETRVDGELVMISRTTTAGAYVRDQGSDLRSGDLLVPAGVRLAPRHLAALASAGISTVEVLPRLRVVVVTTGAELIEPGFPASLGEVYDSNGIALEALARACGADVTHVIRSDNDDPEALRASLAGLTHDADVIITSGGISMGNFEVVRDVLRSLDSWVGTVAMQPGGPQATGKFSGVPVISFPGNPVSSQISFEVFLAPVLRELSGLLPARRYRLRMSGGVVSVAGKRQFLRGRRVAGDAVELVSGPGSHLVAGLAAADVLIDIPADTIEISDGDHVEVLEL
jgi:molybdopterin molybdotransferase